MNLSDQVQGFCYMHQQLLQDTASLPSIVFSLLASLDFKIPIPLYPLILLLFVIGIKVDHPVIIMLLIGYSFRLSYEITQVTQSFHHFSFIFEMNLCWQLSTTFSNFGFASPSFVSGSILEYVLAIKRYAGI